MKVDALIGRTIHGTGPERSSGGLTGDTVCDEASKEVLGSGAVNDAAREIASQSACRSSADWPSS